MVVHEYGCSGNPLSIQFTPYGFPPTGVGNRQVEAVFMQVVPETSSHDMPQRVGEIVRYHLRVAGRTGSKIHQ